MDLFVQASHPKTYLQNVIRSPNSMLFQIGHLKAHMSTHGQNKKKCEFCNKEFNPLSLKKHIVLVHEGHANFTCDLCGKPFLYEGDLRRHVEAHSGQKNHKCDRCERAFTNNRSLQKHIALIHEGTFENIYTYD